METVSIRPSRYLVCVDKSDIARVALRFACIKAQRRGIRIDLIHVIAPSDLQALGGVAELMQQEQRSEAEALLNDFAGEAEALSGHLPVIWLKEGNPPEEILKVALSESDINMIVMGINPNHQDSSQIASWLTKKAGDSLMVPLMLVPSTLTDEQMQRLA